MKLLARQKYDYRDLDRGEAQLIRVGHALWRDRLKLGDTVAEREGINAALESVWKAKREYRAELARKRASRFSSFGKPTSRSAMPPKPPFRLETVPSEFQTIFYPLTEIGPSTKVETCSISEDSLTKTRRGAKA